MAHTYTPGEINALLDRLAIRELIERYFHGMGAKKFDEIASVLAHEVKFGPAQGPEAACKVLAPIETFHSLLMIAGNPIIEIDGDTAKADTQALCFRVVSDGEDGHKVQGLGLRYFDELQRTSAGWRFTRRESRQEPGRVHDTPWQFDVVASRVFQSA